MRVSFVLYDCVRQCMCMRGRQRERKFCVCVHLPCRVPGRLVFCVAPPCGRWRHWSRCCSTQSTPGQGHLCYPENHPGKRKKWNHLARKYNILRKESWQSHSTDIKKKKKCCHFKNIHFQKQTDKLLFWRWVMQKLQEKQEKLNWFHFFNYFLNFFVTIHYIRLQSSITATFIDLYHPRLKKSTCDKACQTDFLHTVL